MSRIPCPAENSIEKKVQCVVLTLYTHWQCVSVSIQHFRNWKLIKVIIFVELLWCRMTRATSVGRPTVIRMTKMKRPSLLIWLTLCCCCIGTGMSQRQGKNFVFSKHSLSSLRDSILFSTWPLWDARHGALRPRSIAWWRKRPHFS